MKNNSVGIIGGGLSGLATAYFLKKANVSATVIEGRERLGGRIFTKYSDDEAPLELGATWLGKQHTFLIDLLKELQIDVFEQYMGQSAIYDPISTSPPQIVTMPYNPDPTYRIKGGTMTLINGLTKSINSENLHLNTKVISIQFKNDKIFIETDEGQFQFDMLVLTIPPKLLLNSIQFDPQLPNALIEVGNATHTWMSESIKVALTYKRPFWRDKHEIGSIFSNTGIIPEMYDHSNFEVSKFALKGFVNGGYANTSLEERKKRVILQLTKYFGDQVNDFLSYEEMIWRNESLTHTDYSDFILPHQNNGDIIYQSSFYEGRLLIGGSETATQFPGYMDGAVESAQITSNKILSNKKALT